MIAGLEIGKIIIIVVYSQVINKPTINGTFSCIDLFFSSNMSFIKKLWNQTNHFWEISSQHYVWYFWLQCTSASTLLDRNLGLQKCRHWKYPKSDFKFWIVQSM